MDFDSHCCDSDGDHGNWTNGRSLLLNVCTHCEIEIFVSAMPSLREAFMKNKVRVALSKSSLT